MIAMNNVMVIEHGRTLFAHASFDGIMIQAMFRSGSQELLESLWVALRESIPACYWPAPLLDLDFEQYMNSFDKDVLRQYQPLPVFMQGVDCDALAQVNFQAEAFVPPELMPTGEHLEDEHQRKLQDLFYSAVVAAYYFGSRRDLRRIERISVDSLSLALPRFAVVIDAEHWDEPELLLIQALNEHDACQFARQEARALDGEDNPEPLQLNEFIVRNCCRLDDDIYISDNFSIAPKKL